MRRKPTTIRYLVSPYNAGETFDRLAHPENYDKPALYFGELLSFADERWAVWYAERRGWFVFGNYMFDQPDFDFEVINIDRRCSKDTIAQVFSSILSDSECQQAAADCILKKLSPEDYEKVIPPCRERRSA